MAIVVSAHGKARAVALGPGDSALCHVFSLSCIIKKLKLLAMYKIIMLQETGYMNIYFIFHQTDRKSINPDVLFYAGQAVGSRRERGWRLATAVLIGAAIYYSRRV